MQRFIHVTHIIIFYTICMFFSVFHIKLREIKEIIAVRQDMVYKDWKVSGPADADNMSCT